ncbi:hypothetical protein BDQ17DRAFT_1419908 [Cyathus striatus]|nr:hypothetical protein BDQ17DRAFT_1419908 [Cyathus striatus]
MGGKTKTSHPFSCPSLQDAPTTHVYDSGDIILPPTDIHQQFPRIADTRYLPSTALEEFLDASAKAGAKYPLFPKRMEMEKQESPGKLSILSSIQGLTWSYFSPRSKVADISDKSLNDTPCPGTNDLQKPIPLEESIKSDVPVSHPPQNFIPIMTQDHPDYQKTRMLYVEAKRECREFARVFSSLSTVNHCTLYSLAKCICDSALGALNSVYSYLYRWSNHCTKMKCWDYDSLAWCDRLNRRMLQLERILPRIGKLRDAFDPDNLSKRSLCYLIYGIRLYTIKLENITLKLNGSLDYLENGYAKTTVDQASFAVAATTVP